MATEQIKPSHKHLSIILRLVIAVFACWITFHDFDIKTLANLNIGILAFAIFVFCIALSLIGLRWWVFMRAQKIIIPYFLALKLTFLGQFFTNFMPSAVGGDLVRAWYISRHTHKKMDAALGVIADRVMGLVSIFILAVSSFYIFMGDRVDIIQAITRWILDNMSFSWQKILIVLAILIGCVFVLAGFFDIKNAFKSFFSAASRILTKSKEVFGVYLKYPGILLFGIGITILLQCGVIISLWLIGRNLGMTCGLEYYFVFFPLMWVISSLPISIGGVGILEGGLAILFVHFAGTEQDPIKALAICQRCIWVISSLPGLWVHLTGGHRRKELLC